SKENRCQSGAGDYATAPEDAYATHNRRRNDGELKTVWYSRLNHLQLSGKQHGSDASESTVYGEGHDDGGSGANADNRRGLGVRAHSVKRTAKKRRTHPYRGQHGENEHKPDGGWNSE